MTELIVLSALVLKPALDDLLPAFTAAAGSRVRVDYDSAGEIDARIDAGARFDLAVLQRRRLEAQAAKGRVAADGVVTLGRSGVAVAVAKGAPHPALATANDLRRALAAAGSVVYPDPALGHACGIHFQAILENLGMMEEIAGKTKLAPASFAEFAARDSAELAIMQPMEIFATAGYEVAGWLPDELQDPDAFTWAIGVGVASARRDTALDLIRFLTASTAAAVLETKGLTPGA